MVKDASPEQTQQNARDENLKEEREREFLATLVSYSLQKEAVPQRNNTCEVWRLDLKRFSSCMFLVRVHPRVRRVLHNLHSRDERKAGIELSPKEIKDAEEEILSSAQCKAFRDEYAAFNLGKPISQKSR